MGLQILWESKRESNCCCSAKRACNSTCCISRLALQTFGGGIDEMKSLAKTLNSTASKDEAVAVARKRYVEKANLIGLIDVARLAANGLKLAAREGAISVDASAIDGLKLQPSFIGLSLACDATGAGAQFEIPVAQAQGIAKVVMLIFNMRNNRN